MDLDRYRAFISKMLLWLLWATAGAMCINQLTESVNSRLAEMVSAGGSGAFFALIAVGLRSVATLFSVGGVFALIAAVVGLMRRQVTRTTAVPYCIVLAALLWGVASMCHSFDTQQSLFGISGRDEGWIALLMYGAMFFLGTMLRRRANLERFLDGVMVFGIVQCCWGLLQALPIGFPSAYRMVEPLLYQNLYLPSGFTDSPATFAMLLAMLLCISIPAAILAEEKKRRISALVCAGGSMLLVFKTQTYAGLIAGIGAVLLTVGILIAKRKSLTGKRWLSPAVTLLCAVLSFGWAFVSPSLNGTYRTSNDEQLTNGYVLYDGGLVWDDGFYRLGTQGPYSRAAEPDFDIYDAASVLRYTWKDGLRVAGKYALFGTGPDNYSFTQLHSSMMLDQNPNTIDRPYNDYLFIAATRGWISLVLHLALICACLWLAWKQRKQTAGWAMLAAVSAAVLYALTAIVGLSVLTVAPLWWMLLGTLAASPIVDIPKQPREKQPKKGKKQKSK